MPTLLTKLNLEQWNKKHFGVMFIVGLLLVVIAMPTSDDEQDEEESESFDENVVSVYNDSELEYKTQLEEQVKLLLSKVDGVGEVDVMITLSSTTQKVVEKDMTISQEETEESTVYADNEDGQEPYVYQEIYPTIEGVVVAAEGGDSAIVIQNITEAIQALFDVDTHKIKIMKMKSSD
ncbi:MAG: stage III sporulation protein AG [Eubacteriales bacterium]